MITIIDGAADRREKAWLFHAMLRQRARVFGPSGLNWEVRITDGEERDILDDTTPVYIIATATGLGGIIGSLRLLPTTGPTLLEHAFPDSAPATIRAPDIWEMSRLCVEPTESKSRVATLLELFDAVGIVAKRAGVTSVIGNISPTHLALYRHLGFPADVLGKQGDVLLVSMPIGRTHAAVVDRRNHIRKVES